MRTRTSAGAMTSLVVRTTDRPVDVAGVKARAERREALANDWLAFYEDLGSLIEANSADCAKLGSALAAFVTANRTAIDTMSEQRDAMASDERNAMKDTLSYKWPSRAEAVRAKTAGLDRCKSNADVRAAMQAISH